VVAERTSRRLQSQDLDAVLAIEAASFKHPWSREMFLRELEHDWSTILVSLEPDHRVGGFLIYWLVHDEIHILNVAVAPEQRRRGIARFLMVEAEKRAQAADIALITLEVRRGDPGARALYQGLDYKEVGLRKNYYTEEGEDAVVMVRELRDRGFQ
jgi:ribosomal-protein-alanine N-acetyltransferase